MDDSERKNFLYQLDQRVEKGLVRRQRHNILPLTIYSYTREAQFSGAWDKYTMMSRGLIVNATGHIVAKPFGKFFNLGERHCPDLPKLPYQIFEKVDGSLGIFFNYDNNWHVATRGSFDNEFVDYASDRLSLVQHYPKYWTICTEISMPPEIDGLERCVKHPPGIFLLGAVDIYSGKDVSWKAVTDGWIGHLPIVHYRTIDDLPELAKTATGTEGWVIRWTNGFRVKIKTAWYFKLFRTILRLDERIRNMMLAEEPLCNILKELPEEFHEPATLVYRQVKHYCRTKQYELLGEVLRLWNDDRLSFVRNTAGHPSQHLLLLLYDDKDISSNLIEEAEIDRQAPVGDEQANYV